jgi:hypothetical protein
MAQNTWHSCHANGPKYYGQRQYGSFKLFLWCNIILECVWSQKRKKSIWTVNNKIILFKIWLIVHFLNVDIDPKLPYVKLEVQNLYGYPTPKPQKLVEKIII